MNRLLPHEQNPDVVTLTIQVNGSDLPGTVPVLGASVLHQVNRIPYARLRVGDGDPSASDFPLSSGELFVPGNEVTILAGYHGETKPLFRGVVTRQRAVVRRSSSWLEVDCRHPAFKMTLTRRNRHFEDATDGDAVETLLSEYALTADLAPTEVTHPELSQYQATDWDFVVSRLEASGQLCVVEDDAVRSVIPSLEAPPAAEILYGATLLELDVELDSRAQSGVVRARAWDPGSQEMREAEAVEPTWDGNGNLSVDDLVGATGREEDVLWHGGHLSADALQAWANGSLLRARLAASRGRARFQGLPDLRPGQVLQLSGVSDRFNGAVFVTAVRHEFGDNDWVTDAEFGLPRQPHAERFAVSNLPAAGLVPAVSGLQVGVVTQLADDPAGEHRVRVRIPAADMEEQGVWARVACLDAGKQRGTFFRPEVDDEVVLGFFHDDPAQPVVLGMLHSSAHAPPIAATEDNHQKAYVSRSGVTLLFDDEDKRVSLETPDGNRLELTDADGGIVLEDKNGNKLTLDGNGITIESAKDLVLKAKGDVKAEGLKLELKASIGFKAEGSASVELSSSGTTTVKGSLVQIN